MAESEMKPPIRIPLEVDYAVGAAIVDDAFEKTEGAWYSYHKEAITGIQTKLSKRAFFENLSSVAMFVEPISDNEHKPVDPLYAATHAFRAGMWTGGLIAHEVYDGRVKYEGIHNAIVGSAPHLAYEGKDEYEANGEYFLAIGQVGLDKVGHEAREYIEKWGSDIVSETKVRKYYALGAGAVVSAFHNIYTAAYPALVENYQVSQILDFDAIDQYLSNNADSSGN